jgi:sphingomyelin phosphodiesterase acid-like 3
VLWSAEYEDDCGNDGIAAGKTMLGWIEGRLSAAKAAGERVWMVHHIPWGIDPYATNRASKSACPAKVVPLMREPFASALIALLKAHADTISASFSGHTHFDDYRLLADGDKVLGFDKIAPAITPLFGNSPGFHVFSYDPKSGAPTDFATWHLANLKSVSDIVPAEWEREYSFSEAYGGPFSADAVAALRAGITSPGVEQDTYRRLYTVGNGEMAATAFPAYRCAIGGLDAASFTACYCGG